MNVASLSELCTGLFYPQDITLLFISVRGWIKPNAILLPGGLCKKKIPMTQSGIDPAFLRFLVQYLNNWASASLRQDTTILEAETSSI
jgi:hypothetical protein